MTLDPKFGLAAAAILLAGAGGAAFAHPHAEGDADGKKAERFVIIHDGKAGGDHAKGDRVRRFEIIRDGKGEHHAGAADRLRRLEMHGIDALADCDGGEKLVDEAEGEDGKKTKVIICSKGAPTAADAERLEKALARVTEIDHLNDEQRARIETALRSAIDRARSAR